MEATICHGKTLKFIGLTAYLLAFSNLAVAANGPADFAIDAIDTQQVTCGSNRNSPVYVDVSNRGGNPGGGYNLQVQLRVNPPQQSHKDYKVTIPAPRTGKTAKVKFDRVRIARCSQGNVSFEAKIDLLGGNYKEGNTRNNQERISVAINNYADNTSGKQNSNQGNQQNRQQGNKQDNRQASTQDNKQNDNNNQAKGAADYEIVAIDTDDLRCGSSCSVQNTVKVIIRNKGRSPGGGYSLQVNLRVSPGGSTSNAKRHREMIQAPGAGKTAVVTFDKINIPVCSPRASNFEADIVLTGGDYQEGNKRNNKLRESVTIRKACNDS